MKKPESKENLDVIRNSELFRLDKLAEQHFNSACAGDHKSADLFIQFSKRKAELLGLDAPTESKLEITTYDEEELKRQYEFFKRKTDNKC